MLYLQILTVVRSELLEIQTHSKPQSSSLAISILKFFGLNNLNATIFFLQGFQRVYEDMADIVLDVPLAYIMLDRFVERCSRAGFLSDKTIKNMPSR